MATKTRHLLSSAADNLNPGGTACGRAIKGDTLTTNGLKYTTCKSCARVGKAHQDREDERLAAATSGRPNTLNDWAPDLDARRDENAPTYLLDAARNAAISWRFHEAMRNAGVYDALSLKDHADASSEPWMKHFNPDSDDDLDGTYWESFNSTQRALDLLRTDPQPIPETKPEPHHIYNPEHTYDLAQEVLDGYSESTDPMAVALAKEILRSCPDGPEPVQDSDMAALLADVDRTSPHAVVEKLLSNYDDEDVILYFVSPVNPEHIYRTRPCVSPGLVGASCLNERGIYVYDDDQDVLFVTWKNIHHVNVYDPEAFDDEANAWERPTPRTQGKPNVRAPRYACAKCGGHDVQVLDWTDPNREAYVGGLDTFEEWNGNTWCHDCQDHTGIVSVPQEQD